ncbi:MAG: hypothetical protein ACI9G1_001089, partial [Pirellulaceae bacterium]
SIFRIARILRLLILRLQEIPVALFGLIKMMVGAADQLSLALLKQLLAISDGATQLKHCTILNANTQTNRGLRQRSSIRQAPNRLENVGDKAC